MLGILGISVLALAQVNYQNSLHEDIQKQIEKNIIQSTSRGSGQNNSSLLLSQEEETQ